MSHDADSHLMGSLGDRLRLAIEQSETTQVKLAAQAGVTQAAISNLVTDASRKPSATTCLRVCEALNISMPWLLLNEGGMRDQVIVRDPGLVELAGLYKRLAKPSQDLLVQTARALLDK